MKRGALMTHGGDSVATALMDLCAGDEVSFERDGWGTLWEKRIFGIAGIPCEYPLEDLGALEGYRPPGKPALSGPEFDALREATRPVRSGRALMACAVSGSRQVRIAMGAEIDQLNSPDRPPDHSDSRQSARVSPKPSSNCS